MHRVTMHNGYTFLVDESSGYLIFKAENKKLNKYGNCWSIGCVFENGKQIEGYEPRKITDLKVDMEMTLVCFMYPDACEYVKIEKIEQIS